MSTEIWGQLQDSLGATYAIERELGGGGMARVFVAEDRSLHRRVAVKVLSPELSSAIRAERFRREIRLVAKLQHPHIVPLLGAGEANGLLYYTMPFIEGESLRNRLDRDGPLSIGDAICVIRDVARALSYAHKRGTVHRDVKPDNVLMCEGGALVADFGLANAVTASSWAGSLTGTGFVTGTPAYMSPEQATGDQVDHRADLYGLGALAYEMLAGRPPFMGASPQAVLAAHVTQSPDPVTKFRRDVPDALGQLIMRCLATAPRERPQSADDVLQALDGFTASGGGGGKAWGGFRRIPRGPAAGIAAVLLVAVIAAVLAVQRAGSTNAAPDGAISVAVLPFANLSANRENEYFADGMTDELINALANVQGLRVTARSSAFALKGQNLDAREIAHRLDVGRVVEGSVRRADEQLRVSAQMVDATSGKTLWSNSYQRNASDALGVQAELASAIATALSPALRGTASDMKGKGLTSNPEAYDLYLRGRYAWSQRTKESLLRGIEFFNRALQKDSNFALAYSGLADSYELLAAYGHVPSQEAYVKARAAATKALALDEGLGEAHATLAVIMFYNDWDLPGAEREFRRALELRPGIPYGHYAYGLFLVSRGRFDDGIAQMRQALKIDPLSLTMGANLGRALGYSRRYEEALVQNQKVVELDPNDGLSHVWLGVSYLGVERFDDAAREFRVAASTREGTQLSLAGLAVAEARLGHRQQALDILKTLEQSSMRERVSSYAVAAAYAALGDADGAFRWLERGYAEHSHGMVFLAVDPLFDPIRDDRRFPDLLKRMGMLLKAGPRA